MNNCALLKNKLFLALLFILPCFFAFLISPQVNADEDCVIEGSVYVNLGYSTTSSSIKLSADVYPDGSLSRNDSCFEENSHLRTTLSASWRSSQDYYLGYRIASSWTLQDQTPHYDTFTKTISKSSFKSGASYRESGGWGYWSREYCLHGHIYWNPTGENMWPGDVDVCQTITLTERLTRTLTVKAIDTSGRSLSSLMPDKSVTVNKGNRASVTVSNISGYSKIKWGSSTSSSTWWNDTGMTYTVNSLNSDTIVYAIYQFNEYQGASQVSEVDANWNSIASNRKKTTGWTKTSKKVTHYINNCDPVNGCTAKFWHNLKRTAGLGSTNFFITRTSNYYSISSGTVVSSRTETFSSGSEINERTVTYTNKLYPGQVVCETLTFNADLNTRDVTTTACAAALGNAQPGGDEAFLDIKVRNQSVAAFSNYQKTVYAKPGDKVTYQATYNPVLQYAYRLYPQKIQINSGVIYPSGSTINTGYTLQQLFNNRYSGPHWKNAFSIQQSKDNFSSASLISNNVYTVGSTTQRIVANNYRNGSYREEIATNDVGTSIGQKALTNLNSNTTQTTPSQITFYQSGGADVGNVITATKSSTAFAYVPYNFINTTTVTSNDSNTTFYAGESATVNFQIDTNTKRNNVTDGTYATVVDSAKWKLFYCVGQTDCDRENYTYETNPDANVQSTPTTGKLNPDGKITGDSTSKPITINIPDVPAGTPICVRSAVWPANSGNDRNWQDKEGSHTWATSSTRECFRVAKKPNLEVWGGNVYSRGTINTAVATKGHLDGYDNSYSPEAKYSDKYVFGSWGESGLITTGAVTGFTSGASLGYAANNSGNLIPNPFNNFYNTRANTGDNPGGNTNKTSTFTLNPLTFANYPTIGVIGNSITTNGTDADKTSIISRLIFGGEVNVDAESPISLNNSENNKSDNIYYYFGGNNNLTVPNSTINADTLQIVHSARNITITGDLTYSDNYANFDQMPKLVIYANNILIDCNVTRIDALLIANDSVITCNNFENDFDHLLDKIKVHINDSANSNRLVVNGAVIADRLIPNRTYGAATGANSMIPAEIINYDPTLYLWGNSKTETGDNNKNLDVSYQKELPPRR